MKKRILAAVLAMIITAAAGCGEAPESTVVREKTGINTETYQEDTDTETSLKERLHVPETYQAAFSSEDNSLKVTCDAEVEVPDVKKVPVYRVSTSPLGEPLLGQIAEAFWGDTPVYEGDLYFRKTKEEIRKRLNELKAYQAAGNTDPYGMIARYRESGISEEEMPDEDIYDLQKEIDALEEDYAQAPEKREKRELSFGLYTPEDWPEDAGEAAFFHGAVEAEESVFDYNVQSIRNFGIYMDVEINRRKKDTPWESRGWYTWGEEDGEKSARLTREEAENLAGITPKEAAETADAYMEKLGLTDFSAKDTRLSSCGVYEEGSEKIRFEDAGYFVYYTRDVEGFPVTNEETYSSEVEESDTTLQSWVYESVVLCINQEGLQNASILNLYTMGEKQVENLKLLDFSVIKENFEKMMQIRYAPSEEIVSHKFTIDRVTLGYMRLYVPGSNNRAGLLVPVWDFFGTNEYRYADGRGFTIEGSTMSWLTINAADGTVISRDKGY
ncbi:MAG: DUF6034 family protein [Eubacteriales bacterium]|nr:DUF6034 family protein [Eubacteriales bacterium]